MAKALGRSVLRGLWTPGFTYWWVVSLLLMILFDLFWMGQTTFRPLSTLPFWPYLFLSATLLAVPSLFDRRGWINLILLLVAALFMTANLMYCRTYYNAIPVGSYLLAGNLADFGPSVADSYRWYFIFLVILPAAAFGFYPFIAGNGGERPHALPYFVMLGGLVVLSWCADAWRGGPLANMKAMRNSAYASSGIVPAYTIAGFMIHDYLEGAEKLSPEDKEEVDRWLDDHKKYIAADDSIAAGREKRRNLVVVLCESLESWPVGLTVEGKEITPYINSLLKDSTTFFARNVVSQVGAGRSIDGQLLVLAGMLPMLNKVYAYDAAGNNFFTLPKAVKSEGGRAYLLTCDKPYVWNESRVAQAFGIDTLLHAADFVINETAGPSRRLSDGSLMAQTVEKMKKGEIWKEGETAFVMVVTYSGHNPFNLPDKLRRIRLEGDYPEIVKNYLVTANYTDGSLATLIEYLKSREDYPETMIVITGDHEGLASDRKTAMANAESSRFVDPGQHTPLIILNSPVGGTYEGQMGEVDIYSTVLDLMGLNDYPWRGMGRSVLSPGFPGVAVGSGGEIVGRPDGVDSLHLDHLRKARAISDRILRFNLLH